MPPMFGDLVVSRPAVPSRGGYAFPASVIAHAIAAGAVVFASLLTTDALPEPGPPPIPIGDVLLTPAGAPAVSRPAAVRPPRSVSHAPRSLVVTTEPAVRTVEELEPGATEPMVDTRGDVNCSGCVFGGNGGIPGGDPDAAGLGVGPPPAPFSPLRPGGDIRPPLKVRHVAPVYPDIARAARVEGTVVLDCTIDREGRVVDVTVLSGPPLLQASAVEAVRQWRYRPTLLNGVPVSVIMTVTVRFTLTR